MLPADRPAAGPPAVAAVSIFTFVWTWNNFLWPFLAGTNTTMMTIPVGLGTVVSGVGIVNALQMASAVLARCHSSWCSCSGSARSSRGGRHRAEVEAARRVNGEQQNGVMRWPRSARSGLTSDYAGGMLAVDV